MSAPQDNDKPVSDPHQEPLRTFDLETGEILSDDSPTSDRDELEVQPPSQQPVGDARPDAQLAPVKQGWLGRIMRPRNRREQQLQTLQSGYMEMLEMMRSIKTHLDHQVQTQEKLVESLKHFPDAVEGLKSIGQATAQQTEVLGMVREQLEQSAHHEEEIVGSMNNFNKTLNQMDETSRTSTRTVTTLMERSRDSETALRALLERSEKRMATLTGLMGFLALAAVGFALYVVVDGKNGETLRSAAPVTALGGPAAVKTHPIDPAPVIEEPEATEPAAIIDPVEESEAIEEEVEAEVEQIPETEPIKPAAETGAVSEEGAEEVLDGEMAVAEEVPDEEVEEGMEELPEESPDVKDAEPTDEDAALEEDVSTGRPGVKGVVRRVFSFLGNDSDAEVLEPVVGDLTKAIEVAGKTESTE